MKTNEAIEKLKSRSPDLIQEEVLFKGETTLTVSIENLKKILSFLKQETGFEVLMDLTGIDYLEPHTQTRVIYWLHSPSTYARIRIAVWVKRDEKLPTVTDLWDGANWYERELYDLFGIFFEGFSELKRIFMPDDWSGHPLRKDYALTEEVVQFKNNVKPKVPSEIIRHIKHGDENIEA